MTALLTQCGLIALGQLSERTKTICDEGLDQPCKEVLHAPVDVTTEAGRADFTRLYDTQRCDLMTSSFGRPTREACKAGRFLEATPLDTCPECRSPPNVTTLLGVMPPLVQQSARFAIILREPVSRLLSLYNQMRAGLYANHSAPWVPGKNDVAAPWQTDAADRLGSFEMWCAHPNPNPNPNPTQAALRCGARCGAASPLHSARRERAAHRGAARARARRYRNVMSPLPWKGSDQPFQMGIYSNWLAMFSHGAHVTRAQLLVLDFGALVGDTSTAMRLLTTHYGLPSVLADAPAMPDHSNAHERPDKVVLIKCSSRDIANRAYAPYNAQLALRLQVDQKTGAAPALEPPFAGFDARETMECDAERERTRADLERA